MSAIKPGSNHHMVLLALRAGPMETEALWGRFANPKMDELVRAGYAINIGNDTYAITESGKAACPPRRAIKPVVNENAYYFRTSKSVRKVQKPPVVDIKEMENTMANGKYKAVDIVKKVHDKSLIQFDELVASFAPSAEDKQRLIEMIKYCIKCDYLEKKAGNILVLGINEVWLARHNLLPATKSTEVGVATNQSESVAKPAAQQTSPQAQASSLSGGDQSDVEGTTSTAESTAQPGQVNEDEVALFLLKPAEPNIPSHEQNGTELIAAIKQIFARLPKLADITIGRTSEDKLYVDIGMLNGEVSMPLNDDLDAVEGVISAARVIEQYRQI